MTDKITPVPNIRRRSAPTTMSMPVPIPRPATPQAYEVGYGKPPKAHRYRKGQSGNPKGRPKGARGVHSLVRELLSASVEIRSEGRTRKTSRIRALLLKQLEKASRGDGKAMDQLIRLYAAAVPETPVQLNAPSDVPVAASAADEAILAMFEASILAGGREREGAGGGNE